MGFELSGRPVSKPCVSDVARPVDHVSKEALDGYSKSERNRQRTSRLQVASAAATFGQYFAAPKRSRGSSIGHACTRTPTIILLRTAFRPGIVAQTGEKGRVHYLDPAC